eukprot:CAMPEP_0206144216 /NCGR_PEP_ID=MMETSP1473-20131121/23396_1 /ASSEMBLY_ACC=CAM_ASM_001109 /TAXON_ID=1461547 /ORGANISM="Stichococcus sp, Strain RCC1054" /LENGTH=491 /DNA_ID=CAMNT_0053539973 /DNA_START=197 /DNA_END=1672 /DNA_ORIENTATION=+
MGRQQVAAAARVPEERWSNAGSFEPSYNLAPGHDAPVVQRASDGDLEIRTMRWGLVPSWTKPGTKPDYFRMFNARSETVAEKGVFNRLLGSHRCVVPVNGFYEWKKEGSKRQPFYVHMGEDHVMMMAALCDSSRAGGSDEKPLQTFTILTTDSSKRLSWLHDRMPVVLTTRAAIDLWLSGKPLDATTFNQKVAVPYNGEDLQWHPVTPELGKLSTQGPICCKPLKPKPGITAFFGKAAAGKKALVDAPASSSQAASEDDSQVPHRAVVNGQEGSNPEYGGKPNSIPDPDAKSDVKPGLHPYVKAELDVKQEEDLKSEAEDHGVSAADREENSGERLSQTASAGLDLASASQPAVEQQEHHGALQHRKQQGTQSMQARQHQPLPAAVDARAETAGGIGASAAHTAQPPTDPAAGPALALNPDEDASEEARKQSSDQVTGSQGHKRAADAALPTLPTPKRAATSREKAAAARLPGRGQQPRGQKTMTNFFATK